MKYFKDTFKYFFDKGPYLVLISLLPAMLLPFLVSPSSTLYYLLQYNNVETDNLGSMFLKIHALPYGYFWIGIIGVVVFVFCFALLFGIVDRHMRIGEFTISFRRAKTRLNYNLLTALQFTLFVGVLFELCNLITVLFYYLWATVFGSGVTWLIFSIFSLLFTSFILLMVLSAVILWPPFMLHTGLSSIDAFKMGWRQMAGKTRAVAFTLVVAVAPFQLVMILTGIFDCGVIAQTILDCLTYAILLPLYVVLMYQLFYDVTGTERMDLQKTDIWSRKLPK